MLGGPDPLGVLYVPSYSTQDDLLHYFYQGQADLTIRPVAPWIFLLALVVDRHHTGQLLLIWALSS